MIFRRTKNLKVVKEYLTHPDIWPDACNGKEIDPEGYEPPKSAIYYEAYDPRRIGIVCYHTHLDGMKMHPYMLKAFRGKYTGQFMREALDIFPVVYAEIDTDNRRLIRFAKFLGFEELERTDRVLLRYEK